MRLFGHIRQKKSKFEWSDEAEAAFLKLKDHLHIPPRLVSPLQGEVLLSGSIRTLAECSSPYGERRGADARLLCEPCPAERRCKITKLEAAGRMLNWAIELNAFDISYEPRKAIKGQAFADFIVEMRRHVFSKNTKIVWIVHVDGSSRQNGCGAGIICQSPEEDTYEYSMRLNFQESYNEAEYEALLCGIKMCKTGGAEEILALSDSQLIVSQVNGDYEARDPPMIKYMQAVHQEVEHLKSFQVRQVPLSENNQADTLSKVASSASCDTSHHVFWEVKDHKSIEQLVAAILDRTSTWMDDIINFKMNGALPDDPKQVAKLQKKCYWFEMWNGTLYKKSYSRPLLRCVTPEKGHEILEDIHQGLCSSHIGGRALAEKTLWNGYYWPTLKEDAFSLVKKCDKCQRFAHLIHRPARILTPITSPVPFFKWGMDLLGPYTARTWREALCYCCC
ncbi:uncharacterized protein [Spinacia oleracea]|uniref:RNase H type-1 domain-containing protein n=1 Tax=Spinacia oleracea TaxID=3562 RepID=A0A9R0J6H6_SPIOL|nr:uncharacterized protein LOC110800565 [Spinacia oleracea]